MSRAIIIILFTLLLPCSSWASDCDDLPVNVNPAIGTLNRSGSPFCVATLIAPNVVLTAAHCVDFARGKLGPKRIDFSPSGTVDSFNVAEAYSYVSNWDDIRYFDKLEGNHDIAILRLSVPVDSTTAQPVARASRLPKPGHSVRVVGSFCEDDVLRQLKVEWTPTTLEHLREGDSGGPIIDESFRIVGISSAYTDSNMYIFANVASISDSIEQRILFWSANTKDPRRTAPTRQPRSVYLGVGLPPGGYTVSLTATVRRSNSSPGTLSPFLQFGYSGRYLSLSKCDRCLDKFVIISILADVRAGWQLLSENNLPTISIFSRLEIGLSRATNFRDSTDENDIEWGNTLILSLAASYRWIELGGSVQWMDFGSGIFFPTRTYFLEMRVDALRIWNFF